ncbi:MAG: hypothetical protein ZNDK_0899 [Candidatus Desulfovibrio kirbyi]|uniref:ATP-binding protein n=1 Tax=Candidatus Desulfovibrio kirbyi TaxID=2696086 RepID=A0A6L2R6B6_9BACT|nr:MAG: hypothetical protein ZNDK_0899 [Candidatus Desulfovibrio kirbyi]
MAQPPNWKPWHKVVDLRPDLRSGELALHLFAADLYVAVMQKGLRPVYEKPEEFFALTFPTHNLRALAEDVCQRLLGENDKAVRQLQLTYGGGKTHALITLLHLVREPDKLPSLPAVEEFRTAVGCDFPKARVAALCFDKIDVQDGLIVKSPAGEERLLRQPWSILAWQIAGAEGLGVINRDNPKDERDTPPAESLLTELLSLPGKKKLALLLLVDEVLMYARIKVESVPTWRNYLISFFQYLTQATTKVDTCCLVASLLASDPTKEDVMGRDLQSELYDVFQRQREEAVEPVSKDDVAEVLRRRFFTPESIRDPEKFRSHVQAALKGVIDLEGKSGVVDSRARTLEDRYYKSYPFHPELTDVFFAKWTQIQGYQKTRGALRTFALVLREAEKWDQSPLVSTASLLAAPNQSGLSSAARELVAIADNADGVNAVWAGILEKELEITRDIQKDLTLGYRELEQAAIGAFLHSQPLGQEVKTRDLVALIAPTLPDKIVFETGLAQWAEHSFWLDDQNTANNGTALPAAWRLGKRPNLRQMHDKAKLEIGDDLVRRQLVHEIPKTKSLTMGARESGLDLHVMPESPRDVSDDGKFHYAILGPEYASEPRNIAPEAVRYLQEGASQSRPRVYRNSLILLVPSIDGLAMANARLRDAIAWKQVLFTLQRQGPDAVDPVHMSKLANQKSAAEDKVGEAVKQAWCMVVTLSEKGAPQCFKLNISDAPHFAAIKQDQQSRVFDTTLNAEALLPEGPYDLWHPGGVSRRVKDLYTAFAQFPRLPKMLKTKAVVETLAQGCLDGILVLRLARPDGSARVWWRSRPDTAALDDAELELWLPAKAELTEIDPDILRPHNLPKLWPDGDKPHITVKDVLDYFAGNRVFSCQLKDYTASIPVPKATRDAVMAALGKNVESGALWLYNPPASVLGEPVPAGILNENASLYAPPNAITPMELLPANIGYAWQSDAATVEAVATALSQKVGMTLPWKTIKDAVDDALRLRFISIDPLSPTWPCSPADASKVRLLQKQEPLVLAEPHTPYGSSVLPPTMRAFRSSISLNQLQDAGDIVPELLRIQQTWNTQVTVDISFTIGKEDEIAPEDALQALKAVLKKISKSFDDV